MYRVFREMKTLYLLLLLIIIIITVLICQKMLDSSEGFLVTPTKKNLSADNQTQPTMCPHSARSYTDPKTGATNCTRGQVNYNEPTEPGFCTLTPGTGLIPCSEYLAEYNQKMEAKFCFPGLKRYYEDNSSKNSISGCASGVNADASAPGPGTDTCKIYKTQQENERKIDSCFNKKAEYNFANSAICKQTKCKTAIVNFGDSPALISSTNIDPGSYRPTTCYEKESALRYLRIILKGDRLQNEIDRINSGQAQEICGYVPPAAPCNPDKAGTYVVLRGISFIELSQIVIKDMNGVNVAPKGKIFRAAPAWDPAAKPENAIDGTEAAREYPNIYHSVEKDPNDNINSIIIELNSPTCISEIITYGRLNGCCPDRQAKKIITILSGNIDKNISLVWMSPETTDKLVQSFKIPASTWV